MIKIGNNLSEWSAYSCQPDDKAELKEIIEDRVYNYGPNCDLNDIDVSQITDMSYLFYYMNFNGDISGWDVSNVKNMSRMFYKSNFNGDISNWDISKVTNMYRTFYWSIFNKDISNWKIDKDCDTFEMFKNCPIKEEYKPKIE